MFPVTVGRGRAGPVSVTWSAGCAAGPAVCPLPNQCCCLQDDLVFVVGKLDGLMVVGFRRHNADDVVATALAVEPMKFVYRGR